MAGVPARARLWGRIGAAPAGASRLSPGSSEAATAGEDEDKASVN